MLRPLLTAAAVALFAAGPAVAQIGQLLDPSLASANWNTSTAVWGPSGEPIPNTGPYTNAWINGGTAAFQSGSAQTVTVNGAVTARSIQFGGANVTVNGSSAVTITGGSGFGPYIWTQSNNISVNVSAPIAGSNGALIYRPNNAGTVSTLTLGGANTYTGTTTFSNAFNGTLTVKAGVATSGSTGALGASTNALDMQTTAITLDLNGFNVGVGGLTGVGTVTNSGSAATFTAGNDNSVTTFAGRLTGTLGLTKSGTGTLTLTGTANDYTGATTVSQGRLTLGASDVLASGTALALAGGTLDVGNGPTATTNTTTGALTLTADSTIDFGSPTATTILAFGNSTGATWTAGRTLTITGWNGSAAGGGTSRLRVATATGLGVSQLAQITFAGFPGTTAGIVQNGAFFEIVPVPEPAAVLGLAAAGLGLARVARRRRPA
jgi:autotransporter-associated beta strand protein